MTEHEITILISREISALPPCDAYILRCNRPGVMWRLLAPLFLTAPARVTTHLLHLIISHSYTRIKPLGHQKIISKDIHDSKSDPYQGFHQRRLLSDSLPSFVLCVVPPTNHASPDKTFLSVVLKTERSMLRLQSLSAWLSTLGGGYFFCKRLSVSLQLARKQRELAIRLNNTSMVRQCSINEAYNLIYAGNFFQARLVLEDLESTLDMEEDKITWNQCQAARLFAKRLQEVAKHGVLDQYHPTDKKQNHTIDDYQRIRIVEIK